MLRYHLFFCLISFQALAQTEPLHFERISGLSQNTVYSIMKDKQGFMWIATADGLNRYDGVEMKIYKPSLQNKAGEMRGRTIRTKVFETNDTHLWFSTEIAAYDFNKKTNIFSEHYFGERDGKTLGVTVDPIFQKDNRIWFANSSLGIVEYETETNQFEIFALKDSTGNPFLIRSAGVPDGKDRLWFAGNQGVYSFDINNKKWQQFFSAQHFSSVTYYADTVFASVKNEIFYMDINHYQTGKLAVENPASGLGLSGLRALYTDGFQNIWAGDENGNVFLKAKGEKAFRWKGNINGTIISETVYPVYCFYADDQGTLWVGADILGLLKATIAPSGFKTFPPSISNKKAPEFFVSSIYEDENETVWVGIYKMGLVKLNKTTSTATTVHLPGLSIQQEFESSIRIIKRDKYKNLWMGAVGCLFVKEEGSATFKKIQIPLPSIAIAKEIQVSTIVDYKNGWLIGTSVGLFLLTKADGHNYSFEYLPEIGQTLVSEIWIDQEDGRLWIGMASLGVYVATDLYGLTKGKILFRESGVNSLHYDAPSKLMWLSTSSGLIAYHLPTEKYRNFTKADGLANSYIYGALSNGNDLWVSTNKGLSKATTHFIDGKPIPDLSFTNFTSNDGLPDNEFNTGAFFKGTSGIFYFGSIKGIVWFDPNKIKANQHLLQMVMTNILVNGENADSTISSEYVSKLIVPYNKNSLFFRFRGLEFNNGTNVNYAYQLKGSDKSWIYSGTLNEARYNNLPPGDYSFQVKAANASGLWNEEAHSVSVIIHPPFWGTWWFYGLMGIGVIGSIVLLTRRVANRKLRKQLVQMEREKEIDKERHRISREMHDDIGAGLTQIVLMSESVKKKKGIDSKELNEITDTSRQLVSSMNEIIWSMNPENKTLDKFIAYLRESLHKQLEYAGMGFTIELPEIVNPINLTGEQRRNILLLIKEILNNAIKHSQAKHISISVELTKTNLAVCVQDDGVGFDAEKIYPGNGLKNIKTRIAELSTVVNVESQSGVGTKFQFIVPINRTSA